jgi:hypothetical protein
MLVGDLQYVGWWPILISGLCWKVACVRLVVCVGWYSVLVEVLWYIVGGLYWSVACVGLWPVLVTCACWWTVLIDGLCWLAVRLGWRQVLIVACARCSLCCLLACASRWPVMVCSLIKKILWTVNAINRNFIQVRFC